MRTSYGISYQGSKNIIAEDLTALLPEAENFYDLFAGGCAMTHCALLSGKYKNIYANDINTTPQLFIDAINGKYDNETTWITKTYFNEHKFTNPYIRNIGASTTTNGNMQLASPMRNSMKPCGM